MYKCLNCGRSFEHFLSYDKHMDKCKIPKRHSEMCLRFGVEVGCPVCDYSTKSKLSIRRTKILEEVKKRHNL